MNTQNSESITKPRGGCCCTAKSSTATPTQTSGSTSTRLPQQRLQVQGATCGGCVRSIEQRLRAVSGVTEAYMDLATGVASIVGAVESNALIEALNRVGFPATLIR